MGIPILREGNVINLPHYSLQVVQACSGLRSMVSLLTISAVMGYLMMQKNSLRGLLFLSAVPVSIFINILRVLAMILAFHYLDLDLTKGTPHTVTGIAIFAIALVLLLLFRGVLSKWDRSSAKES